MPTQLYTSSQDVNWSDFGGATTVVAGCYGRGGNGGQATGNPSAGGGGKGGQYAEKTITKGAESSLSLTVGTVQGINTFITQDGVVVCRACCGNSGGDGIVNNQAGAGATGYASTGIGDIVRDGGNGGTGSASGSSGAGGGGAGSTSAGGNASGSTAGTAGGGDAGSGAAGVAGGNNGANGNNYGGGGSGGRANSATDRAQGSGGAGAIRITWTVPTADTSAFFAFF